MSQSELDPLPPGFSPLVEGDKVAFKEDHPEHPGMYGIIQAIGIDNGQITFDTTVIDPATREELDPPVTYRATMEEIQ